MARGVMPRRPTKSGRHEGVAGRQPAANIAKPSKGLLSAHRGSAKAPTNTAPASPSKIAKSVTSFKASRYNPLAPDRVSDILKRLDQLYPDVTCALTHRNAW